MLIEGCSNKQLAEALLANNTIVLPVALGKKVYCLMQPCGGCECYNEPMTEEFIERCRKCDKWEIGEYEFDINNLVNCGHKLRGYLNRNSVSLYAPKFTTIIFTLTGEVEQITAIIAQNLPITSSHQFHN